MNPINPNDASEASSKSFSSSESLRSGEAQENEAAQFSKIMDSSKISTPDAASPVPLSQIENPASIPTVNSLEGMLGKKGADQMIFNVGRSLIQQIMKSFQGIE